MPTWGISYRPTKAELALMRRCEQKAAAAMLAAGWKPYAKKYREVHQRKAQQLYRQAA